MLKRLISITNSAGYIAQQFMMVKEVVIKTSNPSTMLITLAIGDDNNPKDIQLWEILCRDIFYSISNKIHEPKSPFNRINIYYDHPALWNYQSKQYVNLQGPCADRSKLIGDLFIIHNSICGDWVDFNSLIWPIERRLNSMQQVKIAIPTPLVEGYASVFKTHKLLFSISESEVGETDAKILLIGNADVCSDFVCFGQPYIVAKNFEEKLIMEYRS